MRMIISTKSELRVQMPTWSETYFSKIDWSTRSSTATTLAVVGMGTEDFTRSDLVNRHDCVPPHQTHHPAVRCRRTVSRTTGARAGQDQAHCLILAPPGPTICHCSPSHPSHEINSAPWFTRPSIRWESAGPTVGPPVPRTQRQDS